MAELEKTHPVAKETTLKPPAATVTPPARPTKLNVSSIPISHREFISRLGSQTTKRLVGTTLQLNLQPGALSGLEGFVEDPDAMILFSCPMSSKFKGGATVAKVVKILSNDNGVFVSTDRCSVGKRVPRILCKRGLS